MSKEINIQIKKRTKEEQLQLDTLAVGLSKLFGAEVVSKDHFDSINQEKENLLSTIKDIEEFQVELLKYYCRSLAFQKYHSKWKLTTKKIEKRTQILIAQKLLINYEDIQSDIKENLEEAYKCYVHGQEVACYVMLLRTVEITVNHIYDPIENPNGEFIPVKKKLEWISKNGYLTGADYFIMKGFIEGRNHAIHTVYRPTEKQLYSAFETVINLIKSLLSSNFSR